MFQAIKKAHSSYRVSFVHTRILVALWWFVAGCCSLISSEIVQSQAPGEGHHLTAASGVVPLAQRPGDAFVLGWILS